jgi:hypothetical protein
MRAVKRIVLVLLALAVVIVGVGAFLPKDFRVERSIEINASPEVVFEQVNSLRKWDAWSPWIARDPSIESTFGGPEEGEGATVTWTSEHSGQGKQTITLSQRPTRIETVLELGAMGEPNAYWTFEPTAEGVRVIWGLHGIASGPLGGYVAKMMDHWVGADYEAGLAGLKRVTEALPTVQ